MSGLKLHYQYFRAYAPMKVMMFIDFYFSDCDFNLDGKTFSFLKFPAESAGRGFKSGSIVSAIIINPAL
jgi:hypothetical protein